MSDLNASASFDDAGFFEEDKESLITKEQKGETNPDLYRVSLDLETVKNRQYNARGRFVKDPTWKGADGKFVAKVYKKMYYIINPDQPDRKMYVECPSNWNVPTSQNILSSAFFKLRDMDSVTLKRIANGNFNRLEYWWSLFQIMIDEQQKDLEGKVKILRYGKPVNDIIEAASKGQPALGKEGLDVFNSFKGKDFFLNVFEKTVEDKEKGGGATKKFPSYEKSSFDDAITSMQINNVRVNNDPAGRTAVLEYLKDAPSLRQMESTKWDEAMEQKVIESMRITIGDDNILNQILDDARKGVKKNKVFLSAETAAKLEAKDKAEAAEGNKFVASEPKLADTAKAAESQPSSGSEEASFANAGADELPEIETDYQQLD